MTWKFTTGQQKSICYAFSFVHKQFIMQGVINQICGKLNTNKSIYILVKLIVYNIIRMKG